MANISVQQGYVKSLQVFFEDLIVHGSKHAKGNISKMHLRRPEAAAPKTVSPFIQERMKTWVTGPKQAIIKEPKSSISAIIQSADNEPKRGSLTSSKSPIIGDVVNPNENSSVSVEVGDNADKVAAKSAFIRNYAKGRSNLAQTDPALMSNIVIPAAPSVVKVDSMVIDNDPYLLNEIQQAVHEGMESDSAIKGTAAIEIGPDHHAFTTSISETMGALDISDDKATSSTPRVRKGLSEELDEHALFHARLVQDFASEGNAEIHGRRGDTIVAYEVNDEGWCLVRNGEDFGWIPQSYLELIPDNAAPTPFEIDFRLCVPRPEDRQAILDFIEGSLLFSEARTFGNVEVYTDVVDQILRGGRTITATMATLLELDRNHRNFPNLKSLATNVKQLRDRYDEIAQQCQELVKHASMLLFENPRTILSSYQIMQLMTSTTCGSEIIDRLQEEIALCPRYPGFDELVAAITAKQRALAKAKAAKAEQDSQIVFMALKRPNLRLFKGFIDLRPNPILQLLYNGMDVNQILKGLEEQAAAGRSYDSLESIMRAVYSSAGHDPSVLCMGPGNALSTSKQALNDEVQMSPQQSLQMKAKAIMTALSDPEIKLFASLDSNVSVKLADINKLLAINSSLPSILCNIGLLNWQNRQLTSFQDLIDLQQEPGLFQEKLKVQRFLNDNAETIFGHLNGHEISILETEQLMSQIGAYGRFNIIIEQALKQHGRFDFISELGAAGSEIYNAFKARRQRDIATTGEWFATNAVFSKQVDLYDETIGRLLDNAGTSERLIYALQHFVDHRIAFESIDALDECVISFLKAETSPKNSPQSSPKNKPKF